MRTFAVMYKPPFTHPRVKKFQARSFKDALAKAARNIDEEFDPTKAPVMLVDFSEERAEMVADRGNGRMRILEDENYGEMTDFTRRVV
jgi:hypothetical protein